MNNTFFTIDDDKYFYPVDNNLFKIVVNKNKCLVKFKIENKNITFGREYKFYDKTIERSSISEHCNMIHLFSESDVISFKFEATVCMSFIREWFDTYAIVKCESLGTITISMEKSSSWFWNIRHLFNNRKTTYEHDITTKQDIDAALLFGDYIQDTLNTSPLINNAELIQKILLSHQIDSVVIGSLAELLQGILCYVKDCDIMVDSQVSMAQAKNLLIEYGYSIIYENNKYFSCMVDEIKVDICYDNYNLMKGHRAQYCDKIKCMNLNTLLQMSLFKYFECSENIYMKYEACRKSVYRLMKHLEQTNPDVECIDKLHLLNMLREMSDYDICHSKTYASELFMVTSFCNYKNIIFPLIGLGNSSECKINTDIGRIESAEWIDILGQTSTCEVYPENGASVIICRNIKCSGIVKCILE